MSQAELIGKVFQTDHANFALLRDPDNGKVFVRMRSGKPPFERFEHMTLAQAKEMETFLKMRHVQAAIWDAN